MTSQPINNFTFDPPLDDRSTDMHDVCIWCLRVMDKTDKAIPFVASLLHSYHKWGGLSDKQAESLMNVFFRVQKQFNENRLDIQGCLTAGDPEGTTNIVSLSDMKGGRRR
ncbi:hypothetical protein AB3480_00625 [Rhizobium mongolense]|uniref:hypothetical protein n=1 Tax=Rhizobium mongolense TaxID=57676 RepID=UPI0034A1E401